MSKVTKLNTDFVTRRTLDIASEVVGKAVSEMENLSAEEPDNVALFVVLDGLKHFNNKNVGGWRCFLGLYETQEETGYVFRSVVLGLPAASFIWVLETEAPGHVFIKSKEDQVFEWLNGLGEEYNGKPWGFSHLIGKTVTVLIAKQWKVFAFATDNQKRTTIKYTSPDGKEAIGITVDMSVADRDAKHVTEAMLSVQNKE